MRNRCSKSWVIKAGVEVEYWFQSKLDVKKSKIMVGIKVGLSVRMKRIVAILAAIKTEIRVEFEDIRTVNKEKLKQN
jgi:hypothetical protein